MMKRGKSLIAALALPLFACGGSSGGGSSTAPTPTPSSSSTAAPTPTPSPTAAYWNIEYVHIFGVEEPSGSQPAHQLLQASDGMLYGVTLSGGAANCSPFKNLPCGTVYRSTLDGKVELLHIFGQVEPDGYSPSGGLIEGDDGRLYGVASSGGNIGSQGGGGVLYRMEKDGSAYEVLHRFGVNPGDGYVPIGKLLEAPDGAIYGTTANGGTNTCVQIPSTGPNCGTIFRLDSDGSYQTVHSFGNSPVDGVQPGGGLLYASDGNFYGTTTMGGENLCLGQHICGTMFRMTSAGEVTVVHSFGETSSSPATPDGGLIQASDGHIYGSSRGFSGTFFQFKLSGEVTTLFNFKTNSRESGSGPYPAIEGDDGAFYGTTSAEGPNGSGSGTVYRVSPNGEFSTIFAFGPLLDFPHEPMGSLIQASDGALYGVIRNNGNIGGVGARSGYGALFRLSRN